MRRREFLALAGAAAWPVSVAGQEAHSPRTVGILIPYPETDLEVQDRAAAFRDELRRLGWHTDMNLRLHEHWTADDMNRL